MNDFLPLLKNSKFIYLWGSQVLSQLTLNILNFVFLLRIITITGSSIAASLLWIAYALPALIIGPFAATFVDVVERRRILMFSNLLQALIVFLYALSHDEQFFLLFVVVFIYSFLNQFYVPSEQAALPGLVKEKHLPYANSLFFITQQSAMVLGFGIAGILLNVLKFEKTLYLCGALLFLAFLSVTLLPELNSGRKLPKNIEEGFLAFFKKLTEGYYFIKEHNSILLPFLLLISAQIGMVISVVNAPLFATEILQIQIVNAGIGVVVPVGIGAATGAYVVSRLLSTNLRKKKLIESMLVILSISIFALGSAVDNFSGNTRILASVAALFFSGFSFVGIVIPAQTFLQEVTPGGMRGRVFGNFWFLVTLITIVPVLFSATITEILGIRTLILIMSAMVLIGFVVSKKYGEGLINGEKHN